VLTQGQHFDDHTVLQHQAATGIEAIGRENGEGFLTRYGSQAWAGSSESGFRVASSVLPCLLIQGRR
jgi:hypothetical protein